MATYTSAGLMPKTSTWDTTSKVPLYLSELHMYGSSRLGIWSRNVNMDVLPTGGGTVRLLGSAGIDTFNRGNKFFELSNHLGNVLVTVSDRKFGQNPVNNLYTSFTADVVSATDYAPFGMQMAGRSFDAAGSTAYRYGFNGKENDNEVKGEGNQQDYGMRIYDPRLGRFLSTDPITKKYPFLTPYQYASNSPVLCVDIDGLEGDPFSVGRAESSNRAWEAKIRKTDPENAERLIYEANKNAFMVVGTFLTAGSSTMAMAFGDLILFIGANDIRKGIQKNDKGQIEDGMKTVAWGMGTEIVGGVVGKFASKYMTGRFIVGTNTFKKVSKHLEQFGEKAENKIMLERMRKIANNEMKATEVDINFARHELRESELMKAGKTYEEAHEAVLKEQNMYHPDYAKKLYTEEALKAGDEQITREVLKEKKKP